MKIPGRAIGTKAEARATVWPTGEFSLGWGSRGESALKTQSGPFTGKQLCSPEAVRRPAEEAASTNLVNAEKFPHASRAPRGMNGITTYGRRFVASAAKLMQDRYRARGLCFLTLTVPPLSAWERMEIAGHWGKSMGRLIQWLSRRLKRQGIPPLVVGCTELQERRAERAGEAYLHAHLICPLYSQGHRYAIDIAALRAWWQAELERVIGRPLDQAPRCQAERVRSNASAYLGKYLSKGSEAIAAIREDLGEDSIPGQWWFCSASCRALVRRHIWSGEAASTYLEALIEQARLENDWASFAWIYPIIIEWDGTPLLVGWSGRLKEAEMAALSRIPCAS